MRGINNLKSLATLKKLDKEFLTFLESEAKILLRKRALGEALISEEILKISHLLEEFLIQKFEINLTNYRKKLEIFSQMATVKREFVQRKISLKFHNFEGPEPEFMEEEKFTKKALKNPNDDELINYTRFALFTENGRKLHKNGMVFKLPKKIITPFEFSNNKEAIYTGDGEFKKTAAQNVAHVKYCIYCHKQAKDYCRTGNPVANKEGCPLGQKISEMNWLLKEGGLLAPLACMMLDNPLCILTGERICNDCKKACIFQKQEAVDVPSIESQLLKDVFTLPYGFEIYFLLTRWNPLSTVAFLPKPYNGKKVLVCGAGPAGIANCYYFLREGYSVLLIDGIKLQPIENIGMVEDASRILNNKKRQLSGFGGVMEYGITERFNKNFLTLAQILLQREKHFQMLGGKKFGTDITFDWAKEQGFAHVLMCIGAGKPKLPEIPFELKKGVMTASNLLMSAHLNKGWVEKNLIKPAIIIGAGLTAVDASLLCIKHLKNEVSIFARKPLELSNAYITNEMELEEALFKGVDVFQNRVLKEVLYKNGRVSSCIFYNTASDLQEEFPCKTLIFALGTNPNSSSFENATETEFFTVFGDLSKEYEGSVVKALANAKNKKDELFQKLAKAQKNPLTKLKYDIITEVTTGKNLLKLKIKPAIGLQNAQILQTYKLEVLNQEQLHPVPLTLFATTKTELIFYVQNTGPQTANLFKLQKGQEVSLMRASLQNFEFEEIVIEDKTFQKPFEQSFKKVTLLREFKPSTKQTLFYVKDLKQLQNLSPKPNYFVFLFKEMNCMLSGVCSRCLTKNPTDQTFYYACTQNIIRLVDVNFMDLS